MGNPLFKKIIFSEEQVAEKIDEMAAEIVKKYQAKNPLFVCLLHGGLPFTAKLLFSIVRQDPAFHPSLDTMIVSTYQDKRTGKHSKIVTDLSPKTKVKGRPVILLDDVLDEGHTAAFAREHLLAAGAASVILVVLVEKDKDRKKYANAEMSGFKAPNVWLTGMGMDDAALAIDGNRWMPAIAIAKDVK